MRLIVILIVVAVVGWLAARSLSSQTAGISDAARRAGASVPQGETPRQQVESVGRAVEQIQQQAAERTAREADQTGESK